jgi:hypothetical protein
MPAKRIDPPIRRPVIGLQAMLELQGKVPGRTYVFVSKLDAQGRAAFQARGFTFERYVKGGVRPFGIPEELAAANAGALIEVGDCMLMSGSADHVREQESENRAWLRDLHGQMWPDRARTGFASGIADDGENKRGIVMEPMTAGETAKYPQL